MRPAAQAADAGAEAQTLVDRSALAVQDILGEGDAAARADAQEMLRRARAVMICPQVLRAGFILGGQGAGSAVLSAGGQRAARLVGVRTGSSSVTAAGTASAPGSSHSGSPRASAACAARSSDTGSAPRSRPSASARSAPSA